MQTRTSAYNTAIASSVRKVKAKVEVYGDSTDAETYTQDDRLISIDIQRVGENNKFFGFVVCQRLNFHLRDKDRELNISTANTIKVSIGVEVADGSVEYMGFPTFYVTEVNRNENTNELSITAYDLMSRAEKHTLAELTTLKAPYGVTDFMTAIATQLGTTYITKGIASGDTSFAWSRRYKQGANYEVDENGNLTDKTNLRQALKDIAESVQSIVYVNYEDKIVFRKFTPGATSANLAVTKPLYFTLKSQANKRLQTIIRATELGDNVSTSITDTGSTQTILNNPFMEGPSFADNPDLLTEIMNTAHDYTCGLTIGQFDMEWRGNPATEIGDLLKITDKDDSLIYTYLLNDTIIYNGGLNQKTSWNWDANNEVTESQPINTVSDKLNKTYARVDRVNNRIDMVVSDVSTVTEKVTVVETVANDAADAADAAKDTANTAKSTADTAKSTADTAKSKADAVDNALTTYKTTVTEKFAEQTVTLDGFSNRVGTVETTTTTLGNNLDSMSQDLEETNGKIDNVKQTADNAASSITTMKSSISAIEQTASDVKISVQTILDDGVSKIETSMGYSFDDDGLDISKSGSELSTTINEDGMKVKKNSEEMLVANSQGVDTTNLHAKTYLIIGNTSRFEDYTKDGSTYTACFWIGG